MTLLAALLGILSITVSPQTAATYNGSWWAEFTYRVTVPAPSWVCTGWRYPVAQLPENEWPQRRSCRSVDHTGWQETWGGASYPLPYIGQYEAFVEAGTDRAQTKFRLIEGFPK